MSEPIRVLQVLEEFHPTFTGRGEYLKKLLRELGKRDFEFSVLARDREKTGPTGQFEDIKIHRIEDCSDYYKHLAKLSSALIRLRGEYDVIHLNGLVDRTGALPFLAKTLGKRMIMQMVLIGADDPLTFRNVYRLAGLRLKMLAQMDAFIGISSAVGNRYLEAGMPADKLSVICNGVDLVRFRPPEAGEREQACRELELDPSRPRAVFVGTIMKRKGVDFLLDAWSRIQSQHPDAELIMVGLDEFDSSHENAVTLNAYVQKMRDKVEAEGLNARFVGIRYDVDKYYQASDMFLFPSRAEGFGNVIVESMATALPCIVTPMDGVANDTIKPDRNGYIVETPTEMADRASALFADRARLDEMGREGRRIAEEEFAIPRIADKYEEIYRRLVPRPRG